MKRFLYVFSLMLLCSSGFSVSASQGLGQPSAGERTNSLSSASPINRDSGFSVVNFGEETDMPSNYQAFPEESEEERCRSRCRVGTTLGAGALTCAGLGWFLCVASHHMSHH